MSDPWLHVSWWFWGLVAFFLVYGLVKDHAQRRPVSYVSTVVPTADPKTPAKRVSVGLDNVQEEAVWALGELGWSRKAAIAALTASGWGGGAEDNNTEQMVLAALRSLPNQGMK